MAGLHTLRQLADARAACEWLAHRGVRGLATDSRRVQPGDAFIAWPGYALDGRQYVKAALAAGASACLVEAEGVAGFDFGDPPDQGVELQAARGAGDQLDGQLPGQLERRLATEGHDHLRCHPAARRGLEDLAHSLAAALEIADRYERCVAHRAGPRRMVDSRPPLRDPCQCTKRCESGT